MERTEVVKIKHSNKIIAKDKFNRKDQTLASQISINNQKILSENDKKILKDIAEGKIQKRTKDLADFMNQFLDVQEAKDTISVSTTIVEKVEKEGEEKAKEGDPLAVKMMSGSEKVKKIIAMLPAEKSSEFVADLQNYLTGKLSEAEKKKFIKLYDKYSTFLSTQEYKNRLQRHQLEGQYLQRLREQIVMKKRK